MYRWKRRWTSRLALVGLATLFSLPSGARAQESADSSAIRSAALDYIEGWYEADADRMRRALHPELAKRLHLKLPDLDRSFVQSTGASGLVASTARGGGSDTPEAERRTEVTILDVFRGAASVRIDATEWIDYLHLVETEEGWKILNVLWELRETPGER